MAPGILKYVWGNGESTKTERPDSKAVRALPSSWYTSQEMFELERRAVFCKKWQLVTHKSRLQEPGDFIKFSIVGYEFVLAMNRKREIHGFHNVCRHRAFPVVQPQSGNAKIFACKYHGWSYGLDGKLAKAPKYDTIDNFDKSQNGLFPIRTHVDKNGFVWVNLDASEEYSWEEEFSGIDEQPRWQKHNFDDYVLSHTYEMTGPYNWKILADNFNECYHCPTTHPDLTTLADIESHDVKQDRDTIIHQSKLTPEQERDGLGISSSYFYPNVSVSVLPHFIMLQRFLPVSPNKSTMQYQIFRNKNSTDEQFHLIADMYARVVSEDKELCELAQRNLDAGIFINGELHPRWERGPLIFQQQNRATITEHYNREKAAKQQIWPARQTLPTSATVSKEDEDICTGLACQTTAPEVMAW